MPAGVSNASFSTSASILNAYKLLAGKTIIFKNSTASNATATIHTVTAGKTFYMLVCSASVTASAANANRSYVWSGGVIDSGMFMVFADPPAAGTQQLLAIFPNPIPFAAGVPIKITSPVGTTKIVAAITGWEE